MRLQPAGTPVHVATSDVVGILTAALVVAVGFAWTTRAVWRAATHA